MANWADHPDRTDEAFLSEWEEDKWFLWSLVHSRLGCLFILAFLILGIIVFGTGTGAIP